MNILATGVAFKWNGIDGWLYFLAAVAFVLAIVAAVKPGIIRNPAAWTALGLLLWVITNIIHSG